jgi:hypothetical protein
MSGSKLFVRFVLGKPAGKRHLRFPLPALASAATFAGIGAGIGVREWWAQYPEEMSYKEVSSHISRTRSAALLGAACAVPGLFGLGLTALTVPLARESALAEANLPNTLTHEEFADQMLVGVTLWTLTAIVRRVLGFVLVRNN